MTRETASGLMEVTVKFHWRFPCGGEESHGRLRAPKYTAAG